MEKIRPNARPFIYTVLVLCLMPQVVWAQPSFRNELLDLRLGGTLYTNGVGEGFIGFRDKMAEFRLTRDTDDHQEAWMHFAIGELNPNGEEMRFGLILLANRDDRPQTEQDHQGIDAACYFSAKGRFRQGDWYVNYPITKTSQGKRCYPYLMLRDPKWPLFQKVNLTGRLSYSFDPSQGLRASAGICWTSNGFRVVALNDLVEASFGLGTF